MIATKVGVMPEAVVDGVNGFLVQPGDVDTIVKRWRELILDKALRQRLGDEVKKTIFAKYLIANKIEKFSCICTQLANKNNY